MAFKIITSVIENFQWTSNNGVLSKILNVFVGVDNLARKVKTSYIGVSDKARKTKTKNTYYGSLRLTKNKWGADFCHGRNHFIFSEGGFRTYSGWSMKVTNYYDVDFFNAETLTRTNVTSSPFDSGNEDHFAGFDDVNNKYIYNDFYRSYVLSENLTIEKSFVVVDINGKEYKAGSLYSYSWMGTKSIMFNGYAIYCSLGGTGTYFLSSSVFGYKIDTGTSNSSLFRMEAALNDRGAIVFHDRLYFFGGGPWAYSGSNNSNFANMLASNSCCSVSKDFVVTRFTLPEAGYCRRCCKTNNYLHCGAGSLKKDGSNYADNAKTHFVLDKNQTISTLSDLPTGGSSYKGISTDSYAVFVLDPVKMYSFNDDLTMIPSVVSYSDLASSYNTAINDSGIGYNKDVVLFGGGEYVETSSGYNHLIQTNKMFALGNV